MNLYFTNNIKLITTILTIICAIPDAHGMMRTPMVRYANKQNRILNPSHPQANFDIAIPSFSIDDLMAPDNPETFTTLNYNFRVDQNSLDSGQISEEGFFELSLMAYNKNPNDVNVNMNLAQFYEAGRGVQKNPARAIKHFQHAAKLGNPLAQWKYGRHLFDIENYELAYKFYKKSADAGFLQATNSLGTMFLQGLGVAQDDKVAFDYFTIAAEFKDPIALANLGSMYRVGRGAEPDYKLALEYNLEALPNNPAAAFNIAMLYLLGQGVPKNYELALQYFNIALNEPDCGAQAKFFVGELYFKGKGVQKDYEKAYEYFMQSAEKNHDGSKLYLGFMYENGFYKKKNIKTAIKYYLEAAAQGNPNAQYNLGTIYFNEGPYQDYKKALSYSKKAADQGDMNSEKMLGVLYFNGLGVTQDYSQSFIHFKKSADQGHAFAQTQVGNMFLHGLGVTQDYELALQYLQLAADQGDDSAQCNLGEMYLRGLGVSVDYQLALHYCQLSADQGNNYAKEDIITIGDILNKEVAEHMAKNLALNQEKIELPLTPIKTPAPIRAEKILKNQYNPRLPTFTSFSDLSKVLSSREVKSLSDVILSKKVIINTLFELQKSGKITIRMHKGKLVATQCGKNVGAHPVTLTVHLHDHDRPWEQQLNVKNDFFTLLHACGLDYENMMKSK